MASLVEGTSPTPIGSLEQATGGASQLIGDGLKAAADAKEDVFGAVADAEEDVFGARRSLPAVEAAEEAAPGDEPKPDAVLDQLPEHLEEIFVRRGRAALSSGAFLGRWSS